MSGEIVKADAGIQVPNGFDDLVSGLAANYEAEPVLTRSVSLDERFVQTGVQAANVMLLMAGMMSASFKWTDLYQRNSGEPKFTFSGGLLAINDDHYSVTLKEKCNDPIRLSYAFRIKINPENSTILISYSDSYEWTSNGFFSKFCDWVILRKMEPQPAFEKLEKVYTQRKTLEGKAAILAFYNHFLGMPGQVYKWIESLQKKQESRIATIASQPQMQAEVINKGLEQIGGIEEKLKVLVPDPLAERFVQLEAGERK